MSAAYYPFAAWNLTSYLDHTRLHYSHAAAVSFSATVQAKPTTMPNFIKLRSNASTGNVAPIGRAWKKHRQQQEQQTQRHCTAGDKNQTSRQGKHNEICLTEQQRLGPVTGKRSRALFQPAATAAPEY